MFNRMGRFDAATEIKKGVIMKSPRTTILLFTATAFLFGCAGMSKEQSGQGLGSVVGAIVGYNLGKGHKDQGWAIGLGTLSGVMIGKY